MKNGAASPSRRGEVSAGRSGSSSASSASRGRRGAIAALARLTDRRDNIDCLRNACGSIGAAERSGPRPAGAWPAPFRHLSPATASPAFDHGLHTAAGGAAPSSARNHLQPAPWPPWAACWAPTAATRMRRCRARSPRVSSLQKPAARGYSPPCRRLGPPPPSHDCAQRPRRGR